MRISTEPIGRIPRAAALLEALTATGAEGSNVGHFYKADLKGTMERLEAAGSPVITGGEQRKYQNFPASSWSNG